MATHILNNMRLWRGAYDLAGKTNQLQMVLTTAALEDTAINNTGDRAYLPGLNGVTFNHRGHLDLGAASVEAATYADQGVADLPMTIAYAGSVGSRAYVMRGIPSTFEPGGQVGELYSFAVQAQGTGPVGRGILLEPGAAARTSSASGTAAQDIAVPSGQYLYAILHVLSASAGDTLDVIVESDNAEGFPSATTRLSFAQATAAGSEWKAAAGPITDDWWRVSWTIAGTDPSFTFAVAMGIGR